MFLHQFFVRGLGHVSYLVGDAELGLAAVVDPRRDVDAYLQAAEGEGLRIVEILETHLASGAVRVLDVREASEWREGHTGGALPRRLDEVPDDRPLAVVCAGGYRSTVAASLLQRAGRDHLINLDGGVTAYEAAGYPLAPGEALAQSKEIHA